MGSLEHGTKVAKSLRIEEEHLNVPAVGQEFPMGQLLMPFPIL